MGKVTNINDAKPTQEGTFKCLDCNGTWETKVLLGVHEFECPACRTMRGVWCGICVPSDDEYSFVCNCDNDIFIITTDYFKCTKCGLKHDK